MPISLNITSGPTNTFTSAFVNVMPISPNVTPGPANAFGSTSPIYQPTVTPGPAQISSTPPADLPQQPFNAYANSYT